MTLQKQWQFLKRTAELGKVPHAYLFYGEDRGIKKLALEFIKLLNCENENFIKRPCQICRTCSNIEKMIYPDLSIVEPQDNEIKISQIRELHSRITLRAFAARFKGVIINEAHCLNQEAQSAFLKILEEPKGRTCFILITKYPGMLLPTVISRVERLWFYSSQKQIYPREDVKKILEISKSDLAKRFQYAKELSNDHQNLKNVLEIWLGYFRETLLKTVNNPAQQTYLTKLSSNLELLQTTHYLISTTNINSKLALEILFLEL